MGKNYAPSGYQIINLLSLGVLANGITIAVDGDTAYTEDAVSLINCMKELALGSNEYTKKVGKPVLLVFKHADEVFVGFATVTVSIADAKVRFTISTEKIIFTFIFQYGGDSVDFFAKNLEQE